MSDTEIRCPKCGAPRGQGNHMIIITVLDPDTFCPYLSCSVCRFKGQHADFVNNTQMATFNGWKAQYTKR